MKILSALSAILTILFSFNAFAGQIAVDYSMDRLHAPIHSDSFDIAMMYHTSNERRGQFLLGGGGGGAGPISKSNSPAWRDKKGWRAGTKTNDKKGRDKEYYEWDHTHNNIEVYDSRGKHKGVADPVTGDMVGPAKDGRSIDVK